MPVAFNCFSLVQGVHQLVLLPAVVEALYFVKVLIAKINLTNNRLTNFIQCKLKKFSDDLRKERSKKEKELGRDRVYRSFDTKFVLW